MADDAKKKKFRIHLLDEIRGLAVFCMIFYHAFYTIGEVFKVEWGITLVNFFMPAEPYFAGVFVFISGMACNLSKSNLERGVKLGIVSLGVTLVTYLVVPQKIITFGVLHMLAVCMIVYGLIGKYMKLIPVWLGVSFNVILFIIFYHTSEGYFEIPFLIQWTFPAEWYTTDYLFMFGFPNKEFVSSDYFPLVSWIFLFFAGGSFGRLMPQKKFPKWTTKNHIPPLSFIGRHALLFYIAHQPIIFGICWLVQRCLSMFQPAAEQQ